MVNYVRIGTKKSRSLNFTRTARPLPTASLTQNRLSQCLKDCRLSRMEKGKCLVTSCNCKITMYKVVASCKIKEILVVRAGGAAGQVAAFSAAVAP